MALMQLLAALIVLGTIYKKMISREVPVQISRAQAVTPVLLGVVSLIVSFAMFLGIAALLTMVGFNSTGLPDVARSLIASLIIAALPEELAKLLMFLLTVRIFKKKVRNVYEYLLIGAGVGFGFTLFEEFLYGSGAAAVIRLFTVAAHMVFNILMAKHLGLARFNKETGTGSVKAEYAKAFLIPVVIHMVYDSCNANNKFLESQDEKIQLVGIIISLVAMITLFVMQIKTIQAVKSDASNFCGMKFGVIPVSGKD